MTLSVLEIGTTDLARIRADLAQQLERSPGFFQSLPVLLSLCAEFPDLGDLTHLLRNAGLVPVALLNADTRQSQAASAADLGVLTDTRTAQDKPEQAPAKPRERKTRLVAGPVRSGQQIYARGSDLIVTAAVSKGAEVIADGHIHIYGALRGRALAGAQGDVDARVFCSHFDAELIAVAGNYTVAEDMDTELHGKAVQARMQGDHLLMERQG